MKKLSLMFLSTVALCSTLQAESVTPPSGTPVGGRVYRQVFGSLPAPPQARAQSTAAPRATTARESTPKPTAPEKKEGATATKSEEKQPGTGEKKTEGYGQTESSSFSSKGITSWPTGTKRIALTYDDGPNPKYTPKLLKILKEKKVPATFYMLGESVHAYPKVAAMVAEEGFEVANHSYDHPDLRKKTEGQILEQLKKTHELITSTTGATVTNVRPPFGAVNSKVASVCESMDYKIVLWDVDTNDWRGRSADNMVQNILSNTRDGSIILFHDRLQASLDATAAVIEPLRERGFTFVTVSELLAMPKAQSPSTDKQQTASKQ